LFSLPFSSQPGGVKPAQPQQQAVATTSAGSGKSNLMPLPSVSSVATAAAAAPVSQPSRAAAVSTASVPVVASANPVPPPARTSGYKPNQAAIAAPSKMQATVNNLPPPPPPVATSSNFAGQTFLDPSPQEQADYDQYNVSGEYDPNYYGGENYDAGGQGYDNTNNEQYFGVRDSFPALSLHFSPPCFLQDYGGNGNQEYDASNANYSAYDQAYDQGAYDDQQGGYDNYGGRPNHCFIFLIVTFLMFSYYRRCIWLQ